MKLPRKLKKALKKVLLNSFKCKDWKTSELHITHISTDPEHKNRFSTVKNVSITGYKLGLHEHYTR